jgi:hypothetical protein
MTLPSLQIINQEYFEVGAFAVNCIRIFEDIRLLFVYAF